MPTSDIKKGPLYVDSTNNRVGVGTSSPSSTLDVEGSSDAKITIRTGNNTGYSELHFGDSDADNRGQLYYSHSTDSLSFVTNASERLRIDSSGNLLVGRTSVGGTGNGHSIRGGDSAIFSRDATGETMQVGRNANAGDLIRFNSNGTLVGTIGTDGALNIGSTNTGIKFGTSAVWATTGGSTNSNGAKDLGASTARWQNLYLSGGVYLGGTGSANLLEDYEEGTWTAVISEVSRTTSVTYQGFSSASYTKVGNTVFATIELGISSHDGTTSSTAWKFTGFPFSPNTARGGFSIYNNNSGTLIGGGRFDSGSYNAIGYFALPSASTLYTTFVYQTNS